MFLMLIVKFILLRIQTNTLVTSQNPDSDAIGRQNLDKKNEKINISIKSEV